MCIYRYVWWYHFWEVTVGLATSIWWSSVADPCITLHSIHCLLCGFSQRGITGVLNCHRCTLPLGLDIAWWFALFWRILFSYHYFFNWKNKNPDTACLDQLFITFRSLLIACDHVWSKTKLIVIIAKLSIIYTAWPHSGVLSSEYPFTAAAEHLHV